MKRNICKLKFGFKKEFSLPGGIYRYFSVCLKQSQKIKKRQEEEVITNNLPFVSNLVDSFTPNGVKHAHWSFLKY